jgi:hypothetical protein
MHKKVPMTHVRNVSPGIDGSSVSGTVNFTSSICEASSSCLKNWVEASSSQTHHHHHHHHHTCVFPVRGRRIGKAELKLMDKSQRGKFLHVTALSEAVSCKASERISEFCLRDLQARKHQEKRRKKRRYIVTPITHL